MNIKIISEENIHDFFQILTSDEIFGINDGRFTSFVILSEENKEPAGVMTVQIYPEYIKLERIFVLPEFRRSGYGASLLEIIKNRPGDALLPIFAFLEDQEDVRGLLEAEGFSMQESSYSVLSASLKDFTDLGTRLKKLIPDDIRKEIMIYRMDQISDELLRDFVLRSPHDEVLQFPDRMIDLDRFSDLSMVSMTDNTIKAALLIEETEDYSQFTWCHGTDRYSIFATIFMVKRELESEYGPEYKIRCLCLDENTEQVYKKLFSDCIRTKIDVYKFV